MRFRAIALFVGMFAAASLLTNIGFAWTGPTQTPTGGNVAAPINTGSIAQTKDGTLGVNGLAVFGNSLLSGSDRFLNWGTTAGTNGYGIRDSSGTLQFKNNGGNWESLQTIVNNYMTLGGGEWTASGNNIYNANPGNVGIGTASSIGSLTVNAEMSLIKYTSNDRTFITAATELGCKIHPVLDTIISLGRALDMHVTAEGIETREQADYFATLGCNQMQGYFFSRPVPETDVAVTIVKNYSGHLSKNVHDEARGFAVSA